MPRRLQARHPPLGLDIALHEGEVTYGNVGTENRLDFTVIGPAVNEARRLEGLCKVLGLLLLVSDWFTEASPEVRARLRSVGRHRLRGVRRRGRCLRHARNGLQTYEMIRHRVRLRIPILAWFSLARDQKKE